MEDKILEILEDIRPGVDFEGRDDLVSAKLLKSIDLMTLISELEEEFDIEIPVEDMVPENFESVAKIAELVKAFQ